MGADKLIVVPVVPVIVVPAAMPAPRITAPTVAPVEDGHVIVEAPNPYVQLTMVACGAVMAEILALAGMPVPLIPRPTRTWALVKFGDSGTVVEAVVVRLVAVVEANATIDEILAGDAIPPAVTYAPAITEAPRVPPPGQ